MKPEGGTIRISSREANNGHIPVVEDDGVGFDTNNLFDESNPYKRITLNRKRLSEEVNGSLEVRSVVGKGTRVEILIPKFIHGNMWGNPPQ